MVSSYAFTYLLSHLLTANANCHPGNQRYRKSVEARRAEYHCRLATKNDKARIVDDIIAKVRSTGRFLARLTDQEAAAMGITSPQDPRLALWYEVRDDDRRVRDKVKQSFQSTKKQPDESTSAPVKVRKVNQRVVLRCVRRCLLDSCTCAD
jgi:hypothetical protein